MNIFEKILGKKVEQKEQTFDFAQELSDLHKEALSEEDLEKQPFVKELMEVISKVNRGINFERNSEKVCYLIDKLRKVDGNVHGEAPYYNFLFSLKDIKAGKLDALSMEYVKSTQSPEGKLWINDVRKATTFSDEKLSDKNSDFHFSSESQARFFNEIKDALTKFIEDQENKA